MSLMSHGHPESLNDTPLLLPNLQHYSMHNSLTVQAAHCIIFSPALECAGVRFGTDSQ